jgi:hypothetical protein
VSSGFVWRSSDRTDYADLETDTLR